jgi:hypothetical protein
MAHNVTGMRRLGGLTEPAQMWVRFCVGTSEATDLAKPNPGAAVRRRSVYRVLNEVFLPLPQPPCARTAQGVR